MHCWVRVSHEKHRCKDSFYCTHGGGLFSLWMVLHWIDLSSSSGSGNSVNSRRPRCHIPILSSHIPTLLAFSGHLSPFFVASWSSCYTMLYSHVCCWSANNAFGRRVKFWWVLPLILFNRLPPVSLLPVTISLCPTPAIKPSYWYINMFLMPIWGVFAGMGVPPNHQFK